MCEKGASMKGANLIAESDRTREKEQMLLLFSASFTGGNKTQKPESKN
jgi:hypothetical protein